METRLIKQRTALVKETRPATTAANRATLARIVQTLKRSALATAVAILAIFHASVLKNQADPRVAWVGAKSATNVVAWAILQETAPKEVADTAEAVALAVDMVVVTAGAAVRPATLAGALDTCPETAPKDRNATTVSFTTSHLS